MSHDFGTILFDDNAINTQECCLIALIGQTRIDYIIAYIRVMGVKEAIEAEDCYTLRVCPSIFPDLVKPCIFSNRSTFNSHHTSRNFKKTFPRCLIPNSLFYSTLLTLLLYFSQQFPILVMRR